MAAGLHKFTVQESQNLGLGQAGSAFLDTDGTSFTPSSGVVVAITMITDCGFDTLTAEGGTGTFINTAGAGAGGDTLAAADTFPAGVTIFGRWTTVSIQTSGQQCICYLGA